MFCSCYCHQTREETETSVVILIVLSFHNFRVSLSFIRNLAVTGSNQAYRAISTGQLNALLRLHLRPIDVVVFHGSQGDLVLKGASRLDAFSGYPVRS